ncbi:MAG: membrane protein insertase YidC [Halorhodospira sp.]
MENQRAILLIALAGISLLLYFAWEREQVDPAEDRSVEEQAQQSASDASEEEASEDEAEPDAPSRAEGPEEADDQMAEGRVDPEAEDAPRVTVRTDLIEAEISAQGGDIRQLDLLEHQRDSDDSSPFRLLQDEGEPLFVAQAGLGGDGPVPERDARFQVDAERYELGADEDELEVPLTWEQDGVEVRKIYTFHRDSYLIDVRHEVRNEAEEEWSGFQYVQLRRRPNPPGMTPWYIRSFTGGSYYTQEDHFSRLPFDEMEESNLSEDVRDGWAAMLQHYFLAAVIPPREETYRYYTRALPQETYLLGMSSPWLEVQPGEQGERVNRLYAGPKEQERLTAIGEALDVDGMRLTVDYGFLTVLANPLFWALDQIQNLVKNWGVAILILTLLIKLAFYKLSAISYRSMAKMRRVQPKMQQIRERHADDRQKMNQELMELYKRERINPLGGCLPILVQIPVFISLYWVIIESVELRHAPFMLWIQDLSSRDPYFILPLLMGATMLLQMRLNPPPMDPIQKRVMQFLPFVFTGFFMLFPAGLVLYWLSNNILSIAQQWYIMRQEEQGAGNA